jgi:NADPH-dependent 2,4-dienoyl-CoA reductase/sulfur reductase-like enzyme
MNEPCALAVIGGGPAGLAAAAAAAELGVQVVLFDEQSAPGGQIYRAIEKADDSDRAVLGRDYTRGTALARSFRASGAGYRADSDVWIVTPEREIGVVSSAGAGIVEAQHIIIATGSMERTVPFPGWTLPGVMTAGAGQILLKQEGMTPDAAAPGGVVLAGSGPLLLLVACQYVRAGVGVQALLDMTPRSGYLRALPHLPLALTADSYFATGLALRRELGLAEVPVIFGVSDLAAKGDDRLTSVEYIAGRRRCRLDAELLMVHFGVVPNGHLAAALGVEEFWDRRQLCWRPSTDAWGGTNIAGIALAGDCGGIAGARAAEYSGRLAALQAASALGLIDAEERDRLAAPVRRKLRRDLRIRPFLEALFTPSAALLANAADDTVICRCEEVAAGRLRETVKLGCQGPNQVKAFTRTGMGPCQGRQCGAAVEHIVAAARGVEVETVGRFRVRPPVKPITLGTLATLDVDDLEQAT